jgi:hypothetical protein
MHPTASPPPAETRDGLSPDGAAPEPRSFAPDDPLLAYVGFFAGWFDLAQLAAGRRWSRGGFYAPPPADP